MPVLAVLAVLGVWLTVRAVRRHRAAGPPPEHGPVGWAFDMRWRTVGPLARVENRQLVRHPVFLTGVALTPLMLWAATMADYAKSGEPWRTLSPAIALALVPLGWFTIVATNLLVLRPERSAAAELFAALPAPQPVRTAGALLTMVTATTAAAAFATGWVAVLHTTDDLVGTPHWGEIAAGVLVVAGAVTVGVAVGRWLPFAAFGIVAAVAVSVIQARFLDDTTWPWNHRHSHPVRFLGFLADATPVGDAALEVRPTWWHLVYLAGLIAVMCAVGLARDGFRRPVGGAMIVALGVVAVAGWVQTRPPSPDQVDAMVSYLTSPAEHQTCEQRGDVRYCAYPPSQHLIDEWEARVEGVLALVPPSVAGRPIEVVQRIPTTIGNSGCAPQSFFVGLPEAVADRLTPSAVWPDDGHLHPDLGNGSFPCDDRAINQLFTAVQAGAWAVGLPPAPHHADRRCTADGQARSVLALWLAGAATPEGADLLRDLASEGAASGGALVFDEWDNPPMWGTTYTASDAAVAVAMVEQRRASEIADLLDDDWSHWTDPSTSSTDLAAHLGLPLPAISRTSGTCA